MIKLLNWFSFDPLKNMFFMLLKTKNFKHVKNICFLYCKKNMCIGLEEVKNVTLTMKRVIPSIKYLYFFNIILLYKHQSLKVTE